MRLRTKTLLIVSAILAVLLLGLIASSRLQMAQAPATILYLIITLLIIAAAAALVITLLLDRILLARLNQLTADVHSITERADPSLRVPQHGDDEIHGLAVSINGMLGSLAQALRPQSEERFRALAEGAEDILFRYQFEPVPGFDYISGSVYNLTGYRPEEFYADPGLLLALVPEEDREHFGRLMAEPGGTDTNPLTIHFRHRNGADLWMEARWYVRYNNQHEPLAIEGIARDITARFRMEQALRDSNRRIQDFLESTSEAFIGLDASSRMTYVNRIAEQMFGQPRDAVLGKDFWTAFPRVTGSDIETHLRQVMQDRRPAEFDFYHNIRGVWYQVNIYPTAEGVSIFYRDITDKRQAAEREHTARIESLRALSHELRTPLTPLLASAGLLQEILQADRRQDADRLLANIVNGADTLRHRIDDLLDVAGAEGGALRLVPSRFSPFEVLEQACEAHRPLATRRRQRIDLLVPDPLPDITADHDRLYQVITNILGIAVNLSAGDEPITVTARADNERLLISTDVVGAGITPRALEHLFQPFFQSNLSRESFSLGGGVGLALTRHIILAHGGSVIAIHRPGLGATFEVSLPLEGPSKQRRQQS